VELYLWNILAFPTLKHNLSPVHLMGMLPVEI